MLDKFRSILNNLRQRGSINLFAVLKMDDLTDKWSIFICAPWIIEENRRQIFSNVVAMLRETMEPTELPTIARVVLANRDDHLIQELLEFRSETHLGGEESIKVNGNMIHDGWILESNKDV